VVLSTRLLVSFAAKQTATLALGSVRHSCTALTAIGLADGAAAGQANVGWGAVRTLAASAHVDLDLAGGGLVDAFGNTISFAAVKGILITASAANVNNLIVGGAPNGFASIFGGATHTVTVRPGGALLLSAGPDDVNAYAVTAGTGDVLRLTNSGSGTGISFDIVIVGAGSTASAAVTAVLNAAAAVVAGSRQVATSGAALVAVATRSAATPAVQSSGAALSATATVSVTAAGTGQSAVSLVAIDGEYISGSTQSNFIGDGYYTRKGFTRAATFGGAHPLGGTYNGWDDPNFLVIGNANTDPGGLSASNSAYLDVIQDAGLTCGLPTSGAIPATEFAAHNMACTVTIEASTYPTPADIPSGARPAVMGIISGEEPWSTAMFQGLIDQDAAWLAQDTGGRFHHTGFFDNILNGDIDFTITPHDMATAFDVFTCDSYWFAGAWDNGNPAQIPLARYNLRGRLYVNYFNALGTPDGQPRSVDETARGCHYGSQNDSIRKTWTTGESRPMGQWVETGAPYTEADSMAITPAQLGWAMWSIAVHGSRLFPLFDHSFRPDHITASTYNDPVYGFVAVGGANTGIYAASRTINRQLLSMASVLNSPKDGYFAWGDDTAVTQTGFLTAVTSTNTRSPFSGVDAVCKWHPVGRKHYILAHTRESQTATNIPVIFRMVDQGQATATELWSNRSLSITRGGSIPAGFCELADTFATAATPLAYRIEDPAPVLTAPTFVASGAYHAQDTTTHNFAAPAGVVANSLVVIVAWLANAPSGDTITLPTGFTHAEGSPQYLPTEAGVDGAQNHRLIVAWHRASGTESGPYTMTLSPSGLYVEGQAHRVEGVVTTGDPWDDADYAGTNFNGVAGDPTPAVSVTTTGPARLLIHAVTGGGIWTPASGFTKHQQSDFGLSSMFEKAQASAGSSGTVQASSDGVAKRQAWLGALIPAGG
jgi:hypothetical protein